VSHPRILGIGTANPPVRLTQEQSFHAAGYQGERIRKIFLNSAKVTRIIPTMAPQSVIEAAPK
jgi:hypothetical protein